MKWPFAFRHIALLPMISVVVISIMMQPSGSIYQSFVDLTTSKVVMWLNFAMSSCLLASPCWMFVRCVYFIFQEDKYVVGDKVQVNGRTMTVQDIHIGYTLFKVDDHLLVRIPNLILMKSEILNLTRNPNATRTSRRSRRDTNVVRNAAAA